MVGGTSWEQAGLCGSRIPPGGSPHHSQSQQQPAQTQGVLGTGEDEEQTRLLGCQLEERQCRKG